MRPAGSCTSCAFFLDPRTPAKGVDVSRDLNNIYSHGICRRFPKFEQRKPDDCCGEYERDRDA